MADETIADTVENQVDGTEADAKGEAAGSLPEFVDIVVDGQQQRITGAEALKRLQMDAAAQVRLERAERTRQEAVDLVANSKTASQVDSLLNIVLDQSKSQEDRQTAMSEMLRLKGTSVEDISAMNQNLTTNQTQVQQAAQAVESSAAGSSEHEQAIMQLAQVLKEVKDNQTSMQDTMSGLDTESLQRERQRQQAELDSMFDSDKELGSLARRLGPRSKDDAKKMVWDKYVRIATDTQRPGLESMQAALAEGRAFYSNIDTPEGFSIPGSIPGFGSEGSVSTLKLDGPPKQAPITDSEGFSDWISQTIALKAIERHNQE